ncbi:MAG: DUF1302 family protein [Candidatus Saccharicenans sp.]|nr:MAG: hypothetical protein C0168_11385 [Candidatus Aminicenantes bacterium]HEK85884.1 hypothetical protein [Candidatus Aminicenantes bacterium]
MKKRTKIKIKKNGPTKIPENKKSDRKTEAGSMDIKRGLDLILSPGRKAFAVFLLLAVLNFLVSPAFSQTKFDFSGLVKLFLSFYASENLNGPYFYHKAGDFAFKRIESRFSLSVRVNNNVTARVRLDAFASPDALFSNKNFPETGILASAEKVEPFEISLYEAYIRVNHFLLKNLDLTVGKQRIPWGTADKLNVVDNLNPLDFANFLTFDPDYYFERRPQTAFNLEYYPLRNSKIQFVWLPERQISPLPAGFTEMLKANLAGLSSPEININRETSSLKRTNYGLRLATVIAGLDLGLTYYRGNYGCPYIQGVEAGNPLLPSTSEVYFSYPREQVLGLDFSGELKSVGWWAELARVQPEKIYAWLDNYILMAGQLIPVALRFKLMDNYYWQWVVGGDYTFSIADGFYLNAQYVHGLFDEAGFSSEARNYFGLKKGRWFGAIGDYLASKAELRLLRSDLKLSLNSIISINSNETTKTSAILYPSVEYKIHDAFYLQAGGIIAFGNQEMSKFGSFSRDRVVYLLTKVSF